MRAWLAATVVAVLLLCVFPVQASGEAVSPLTITGLDAHDGTIMQDPDTDDLYLYGTRYGCGFRWRSPSPWCGFGVWKSTDGIGGPWKFQRLLFTPSSVNTWRSKTWQQVCGDTGDGCFNPRMMRRTADGIWILAFNAPGDYAHLGANAYYFMGCAGPAGPCGPGVEHGSLTKPRLWACAGNGDFSTFSDETGTAYMVCTMPGGRSLRLEQLDKWWTNGVQGRALTNLAGVSNVESPAVARTAGGGFRLIFGTPRCGYCASGAGWAVFTGPIGGYVRQPDFADADELKGQPRTVFTVDGEPWLWVDEWKDREPNQADAPIRLLPLKVTASTVQLR